jgi:hypothetical protein
MLRQQITRAMRWGIVASICLGLGMGTAVAQTDEIKDDAIEERLADEESADGAAFPDMPSDVPPPLPIDDLDSSDWTAANPDDEGVDVLTRGPVHEAFAEPIEADPQAGVVIAEAPPEPIEEIPPELKPEGRNVVWISGYWAWDDDRDDFLWVSGVWRNVPPGRRWIPGYWNRTDDGWWWISGLWAPVEIEELVYREPPPETLEAGPSSPLPSDQHFWVPGCWMWQQTGYRWRPGFWSRYQVDWVWVPAHWVWTPRGCLFVPGYWDHRVTRRGHLFAPVYFHAAYRARPHWYYSPSMVIDAGPLLVHFWVRPSYRHYYFGDYYNTVYVDRGFTPWSQWHVHRGHWDPLLIHSQVYYQHRFQVDYVQRMQQWHTYYVKREDERPRRTFQEQVKLAAVTQPSVAIQQSLMVARLDDMARKRPSGPDRLTTISTDTRKTLLTDARGLRELTQQRSRMESLGELAAKPDIRKLPSEAGKPSSGRPEPPASVTRGTLKLPKAAPAFTRDLPTAGSTMPELPAARLPGLGPSGRDTPLPGPASKIPSRSGGAADEPAMPKTPAFKLPGAGPSGRDTPLPGPASKIPSRSGGAAGEPSTPRTPTIKLPGAGSSGRDTPLPGPSPKIPSRSGGAAGEPATPKTPAIKLPGAGASGRDTPLPGPSPKIPSRSGGAAGEPSQPKTPAIKLPGAGASGRDTPLPGPSPKIPSRSGGAAGEPSPPRTPAFKLPGAGPSGRSSSRPSSPPQIVPQSDGASNEPPASKAPSSKPSSSKRSGR